MCFFFYRTVDLFTFFNELLNLIKLLKYFVLNFLVNIIKYSLNIFKSRSIIIVTIELCVICSILLLLFDLFTHRSTFLHKYNMYIIGFLWVYQ